MPRRTLKEKAKYCCLCGNPLKGDFSIEHIIPRSKGGKTCIHNILVSHTKCNSLRGNKTWILPQFSITGGTLISPSERNNIMNKARQKGVNKRMRTPL